MKATMKRWRNSTIEGDFWTLKGTWLMQQSSSCYTNEEDARSGTN